MADSDGKQTGVLGRLRSNRDRRRQRRAEKAHAKVEAKRAWEGSGEANRHAGDRGAGSTGAAV